MFETKALAKHTKRIREELKESQETFAVNCGIRPETIHLIEHEKTNPTLEVMQKIAAYAGCTVSDLLNTAE